MKFVRTLDLWNYETLAAVEKGTLKLQVGQWVRCGNERPSRLVRVSDWGTVHAIHPKTEKGRDSIQYRTWLDAVRTNRTSRKEYESRVSR